MGRYVDGCRNAEREAYLRENRQVFLLHFCLTDLLPWFKLAVGGWV